MMNDIIQDYIEDIDYCYPKCNVVKDPFVHAIGRSIGLTCISRFWEMNGGYRLTFNSNEHPFAMSLILFSYDRNDKPKQVIFQRGQCVMSVLEKMALNGDTFFISNSIWNAKNIVWPAYWTKEQVMIDLDLKGF